MKTKFSKSKMISSITLVLASLASHSAQAQSSGFVPPYLFPGGIKFTSPIISEQQFIPSLQSYHYDSCLANPACINAINTNLDVTTGVSLVLGQQIHNDAALTNANFSAVYQLIDHSAQNSDAHAKFAISTANGYTDNQVANLQLVVKQQIGAAAETTLASANVNAQSYASNAQKLANLYTDDAVSTMSSKDRAYAESITSAALVTSVKQSASYTDGVAASTLRSANEYTNATARENRQYTDTAVNQSEVRQTAYTNQVASKVREEMGFMNKRTQDEANAGIAAAAAAPTAPGGQGRWIGGGLSRYRNAVALGVTGSYEDANSRTFSASLSRSLSGGGGTLLTLKAGTKF